MKSLIHALIGIFLLLVVWQLLALILNKSIVPAPAETLSLLAQLLVSGPIILAAWQTAWKVFLALLLVLLIGLPLGLGLVYPKHCITCSGLLLWSFRQCRSFPGFPW